MWFLCHGPGLSYSLPVAEASPESGNGVKKKKFLVKVNLNFPFSQVLMNNAFVSWAGGVPQVCSDWAQGEVALCWGGGKDMQADCPWVPGVPRKVGNRTTRWQGGQGPCGELEQRSATSLPPCWLTCIVSPRALVRELDWGGLPLPYLSCTCGFSISPCCWTRASFCSQPVLCTLWVYFAQALGERPML